MPYVSVSPFAPILKRANWFWTAFLLLVLTNCALAQVDQYAPFSTNDTGIYEHILYAGDHESISPFSGNLNLQIPLVHLPGRAGHDFSLSISYNSNFWYARTVPISQTQTQTLVLNETAGAWDIQALGWNFGIPYMTYYPQLTMNGIPYGETGNIVCDSDYVIVYSSGAKIPASSSTARIYPLMLV